MKIREIRLSIIIFLICNTSQYRILAKFFFRVKVFCICPSSCFILPLKVCRLVWNGNIVQFMSFFYERSFFSFTDMFLSHTSVQQAWLVKKPQILQTRRLTITNDLHWNTEISNPLFSKRCFPFLKLNIVILPSFSNNSILQANFRIPCMFKKTGFPCSHEFYDLHYAAISSCQNSAKPVVLVRSAHGISTL